MISKPEIFLWTGIMPYLAAGEEGLRILDIADQTQPLEIGRYNPSSGYVTDVYVSGTYAYLADSEGLLVIDITDKASPVEEGFYNEVTCMTGIHVSGDYAFVEYELDSFGIIDISNKTRPVKVGSYEIPFYPIYDIYVSEEYIFLVFQDWTADPINGGLVIAQLTQRELADIFILDPQTITATAPDSLPDGMYDVVVENPDGLRGRFSDGFMVDTTPPELVCPSNITKYVDPATKKYTVNFSYQVTNNLDPDPEITKDPTELPPGFGTSTMTLTATDHLGNTSQCSFTFTFKFFKPQPVPYPGLSQVGIKILRYFQMRANIKI